MIEIEKHRELWLYDGLIQGRPRPWMAEVELPWTALLRALDKPIVQPQRVHPNKSFWKFTQGREFSPPQEFLTEAHRQA